MMSGKPKATRMNKNGIISSAEDPNISSGGKVAKNTGANWIKAIEPTK